MNSPKIIAEIGCNHKGDMQIAREMIMTVTILNNKDVNRVCLSNDTYRQH